MSNQPLNIIFAGTPDFAAATLAALVNTEHNIIAAYTQPDRPAGRGKKLKASPVKELAQQHDIPVYQPKSLRSSEAQAELAALNADLMIVVAYGLILPKEVLEAPRFGCMNVHASILPRWRGAAPIHRSLLAGDTETGVTIMQMDEGLDTGDMLHTVTTPISTTETSGQLHDRLAAIGAQAMLTTLAQLCNGKLAPEKQDDSLATYAHKLEKQEGNIDWSQPAEQVDRQIRGLSPWPIAFTQLGDATLRIHGSTPSTHSSEAPAGTITELEKDAIVVACGDGRCIGLTRLQLPGGKVLAARDLLNSRRDDFAVGTVLGA
ncbi:methionyl-tRNA formyltransferase [Neptunomonas marina]|uniref:Methionyl-tRNA formyltransferase n=1 Tax=Neptunomonas marina TaxID=1815562 RepID=A0A437QB27_9GAMM|nr:methionyl-tRNA formyltransferase [Neptunomonas marina]RVU31717.1 methionyl-tRNA formyltransferase [Neptunomonas marina]